jgi:hypothetical protein
MRRSVALVPVLALALLAPHGAAAQGATPGGGTVAFPVVPDPAACEAAPRDATALLALWFEPAASPVPAEATAAPEAAAVTGAVAVPVGPPADEATTGAITATARQVFACFAAGDALRAYALFTDELAQEFRPEPGVTRAEAEAFLAAPTEPEAEAERSEVVAVASPMVLPDGRVGAFVVDRTGDEQSAAYAIFERRDGAWLVDGLIEFGVAFEAAADGGTPVP